MRWSAEKLRWLALGGTLLLAGVLAAFFGLANYRAGKIWQRILKRNGVNLVQESNGVTYSQSVGGRTVFTLHAEKSTPRGNGIYSLHNAVLILYGKDGRNDRIHGNEFEYDQNQGILKAIGEVHMDLQAPAAAGSTKAHAPETNFSFAPDDEAAADPQVIHVRTSGLVYLRKLGVAATKERAEFSYRGMRCDSEGAEFDTGPGILHLLSNVHLAGTMSQAPFTLAATHADLNRSANTIRLAHADWASGDRAARADEALLWLRKDGSLETGDGEGNVVLRSATRTLGAPQVHAQFGEQNRLQRALFTGGVRFADATPTQVTHGTATQLTLVSDGQGTLHDALAEGGVQLHVQELANGVPNATRDLKAQRVEAGFAEGTGASGAKKISVETTSGTAARKQAVLRSLHMVGDAHLMAVSPARPKTGPGAVPAAKGNGAAGVHDGETRTLVSADDLLTTFAASDHHQPEPQRMVGTGHTALAQYAVDGSREFSESETLDAQFVQRPPQGAGASAPLEVSTAVQTRHVVLHSWPATHPETKPGAQGAVVTAGATPAVNPAAGPSVGYAQRAVFQAAGGTLTLTADGGARAQVDDGTTQLQAPEIVLHQGTGDGEASGGVVATTVSQPGTPATHVLAARAKLHHALNTAEFFGSDREPAQMWQGTSQVTGANLLLDSRHHTLAARPEQPGALVHGIFASEHANQGAKPDTKPEKKLDTVADSPGSTPEGASSRKGRPTLADQRQTAASGDAIRVAAEALDYSDPDREATLHGHVVLRGTEGTLTGDRGVVFLSATPAASSKGAGGGSGEPARLPGSPPGALPGATPGMGGRLDRFVLLGDVHLLQPGRTGQGQQLTYTSATDRYVLTGTPGVLPRVVDVQQGLVTGETLVFGAGDRSVVVATQPGTSASAARSGTGLGKPAAGRRVHTETDIKR